MHCFRPAVYESIIAAGHLRNCAWCRRLPETCVMERARLNAALIWLESELRAHLRSKQLPDDNVVGYIPDFTVPLSQRPPKLKGKTRKYKLTAEEQDALTEVLIDELPEDERAHLQE